MRDRSSVSGLKSFLDDMVADLSRYRDRGDINRSIPQLARVDPDKFGIAVASLDGQVTSAGDAAEPFSVQSISKVFTLTLAIGGLGDALWKRVGREPSGSAFNSIVQLESDRGIPRNPFINAGALVVADIVLAGLRPKEAIGEILRFTQFLANDISIRIDPEVAKSEAASGFRNAALANYLRAFENLHHPVEEVLGTYFHQCAIAMSCQQLAQAGLFLANGGRNAFTRQMVVSSQRVRRINALMLVCGQYDGSGEFAYRVGLPAKSGVGGGILAIVPGRAAITVWSPGLNPQGNSQLGTIALERLARWAGWSVFGD
jgi:glutaminase